MRHLTVATMFVAALAVSGSAFAQNPASTDGKSVPMEKAPEKIKPAGKSRSEMHKQTMHGSKERKM